MGRREELEAAFDKLEAEDTAGEDSNAHNEERVEAEPGVRETAPGAADDKTLESSASGEKDKKTSLDKSVGNPPEEKEEKQVKDKALERAAIASASTADATRAPISWKPGVKEKWNTLPVDVKQEILRREKEMSQFITQNDHHRKFTESFAQIVKPYHHLIQAQNSTPLQAVKNVFNTMAGLTLGNQEQKARIVSEIIQNYGIDVRILDQVLSSGVSINQAPARTASMDPTIMQALQPVYGFMNEIQQARQQREMRQMQEAEALIEQHAEKPFFDDLRDDIADLMEIAAKRGVDMSIDQAYEKALALNPEMSKIVADRKAAEQARMNGGTRVAKARRAASTITGAPVGTPDGKGGPKSRREALEEAWEEAAQR